MPSVKLKGLYTTEQIDLVVWDDRYLRIGFRFTQTQVRCNQTLRLREGTPSRLPLEHQWKNEGVAPWQHLVAFVETTPNTVGGHLAIEKGKLEGRFDASLVLDDVNFELLESA